MEPIIELQERINNEIKDMSFGQDPEELYNPIIYIMGLGGKRMRPLFTLLTFQIFNPDIDAALPPAIAVELFHNFTLMHDDLMDRAPLRRGKPTVHIKWNDNISILAGDVIFNGYGGHIFKKHIFLLAFANLCGTLVKRF